MSESSSIDPTDIDGWQFVFQGDVDNWPEVVADALGRVETRDDRAHHILSREVDGPRWTLLLVHYSAEERQTVHNTLSEHWAFAFVNAVIDITEENQ